MKESTKHSRRDFLKKSAVLSSFFIVPRHVLGGAGFLAPSDKITLGFIGCGKQSGGLRNRFLSLDDTQLVAASDVYKSKLETFIAGAHKVYEEKSGSSYKAVEAYDDFRELLARKDIDAVVIVSPDHWHASMAVKAAEAGKDIYCEKPLSLTVKEGRAMVKAARKHDRVFQTGSMQRSSPEFTQAVQLVRSGAIGTVQKIHVSVGGPPKPWDLAPETAPADLNWDRWMGPNTIERPFSHRLAPPLSASFWPDWRSYDEFGGGFMTDWGAHMFDIGQWGLDMDASGPTDIIYPEDTGKEGKGLIYQYANGVQMIHRPEGKNYCHFVGTEGEVWVTRGEIKTTPDNLKAKTFKPEDTSVYVCTNHYQDFLNAVKTRKNPICDVEVGHRTATVCNIGNIAYRLGTSLRWDPAKEKFKGNKAANKLLGRPLRKEWAV